MDMISHQAVCVNLTLEFVFKIHEICPVKIVIVIRDKNSLSIMTTLNNMVGSVWKNYSCRSKHRTSLLGGIKYFNK